MSGYARPIRTEVSTCFSDSVIASLTLGSAMAVLVRLVARADARVRGREMAGPVPPVRADRSG
jgi:hypothetical protein